MKHLASWSIVALLLGACAAPAPQAVAAASADLAARVAGDLRLLKQLPSQYLERPRDVWVWLPPGYERAKERYPVLYMHDGNNCFDPALAFGGNEWQADETATKLIRNGEIPPMILVGVGNTAARLDEYTWVKGSYQGKPAGGQGASYAKFLVSELKPLIDRSYRTRPDRANTGVLGSSLGGLQSFYLARYEGDVFSKIGIMSPSVWWADRAALKEVPGLRKDLRIWLDMGHKESDAEEELDDARALDRALVSRGYPHGETFAYYEDLEGGHNERAWAYRLPMALRFLFR